MILSLIIFIFITIKMQTSADWMRKEIKITDALTNGTFLLSGI
jgi:hypothetical protein